MSASTWYFAIGSMMNKVSMAARGLTPLQSVPAVIRGYRLEFRGKLVGTATATPLRQGDSEMDPPFHGVLHEMQSDQMADLDVIEGMYNKKAAIALRYDGTKQACFVYVLKPSDFSENTQRPDERYVQICADGAESHGVDKAYVAWLRKTDCIPRDKPKNFLSYEVPSDVKQMTMADVISMNNEGLMCFVLNGKVLLCEDSTKEKHFYKFLTSVFGKDATSIFARMVWEPKYGLPPRSTEEMSDEHKCWVEHINRRYLGEQTGVRVIGIIATDRASAL